MDDDAKYTIDQLHGAWGAGMAMGRNEGSKGWDGKSLWCPTFLGCKMIDIFVEWEIKKYKHHLRAYLDVIWTLFGLPKFSPEDRKTFAEWVHERYKYLITEDEEKAKRGGERERAERDS